MNAVLKINLKTEVVECDFEVIFKIVFGDYDFLFLIKVITIFKTCGRLF